jgi:hypothetical protein
LHINEAEHVLFGVSFDGAEKPVEEKLQGLESLLTIDHKHSICVGLLCKEDSGHWQPEQQGLDESRGFLDVPDIVALERRNENVVPIQPFDKALDVEIRAKA